MRSHEERLAAVKQRDCPGTNSRKRIRRIRLVTTVCSAAACLAVIVGLPPVLMPGIVRKILTVGQLFRF